jgi:chaperonin cofactor prefoldin
MNSTEQNLTNSLTESKKIAPESFSFVDGPFNYNINRTPSGAISINVLHKQSCASWTAIIYDSLPSLDSVANRKFSIEVNPNMLHYLLYMKSVQTGENTNSEMNSKVILPTDYETEDSMLKITVISTVYLGESFVTSSYCELIPKIQSDRERYEMKLEQFREKISVQFSDLFVAGNAVYKELYDKHTSILNKHNELLDTHSRLLERHSMLHDQHNHEITEIIKKQHFVSDKVGTIANNVVESTTKMNEFSSFLDCVQERLVKLEKN